ncbi:hypothetical protein J7E93_20680 [Streptomyces sp. ISL-36]|uniref:hypothetical protein n=1 Tax=Streptomyces sp. ISL-36 TaxID=2819182 RepID=UPI001BE8A4DF|nr:hypothetical protein [Streptomyces sp. ISL-36]MBT2442479.1 hypothetical protein [Streptomyces sp. ISL-36]
MDDDAEQQHPSTPSPAPVVTAAPSYARDQWAKAFTTALTHDDAATRDRAAERGRRWRAVLTGMAEGRLKIGSRTPVKGLPAWVTPEVVRGGFATGAASAAGPLQPYETEAARRFGVPAARGALFAHCLTEPGLAWLSDLLDSGHYEVTLPEEAALLTVAWLVRSGEVAGAVELVEALEPHADTVRFLPRPSRTRAGAPGHVHRRTVAEARRTLERRRPNEAVETQREALAVWNPYADDILGHWLETADTGRVLERTPDDGWYARGAALLERYRALAAEHTRCRRHRDPKENLGILIGALQESVARRPLDPRRLGLLRTAVEAMVRRRGLPGSAPHADLRRQQAAQAALPSHHALAGLASRRLAELPQDSGAEDIGPLTAEVSVRESRETSLPVGAVLPPSIRRVVDGTLSAPLATLVERGVVPSAEVLAQLVPQLVAATTARSYADEPLRTLMAADYRACRNRRSLLLLNLERQVRVEELPWVRAVTAFRADRDGGQAALDALRELGEIAVRSFPGTILPNPLVRELAVLARQADLGAPLVEELAADIFMGTFSPKFLTAARVAAELLSGTLYERYYGIDYPAVRDLAVVETSRNVLRSHDARTSPGFATLCARRAGDPGTWSVAGNGKVIEQAQILTTHNLATLVHRVHIAPGPGWDELALRCFRTVCRLTARLEGHPRPLATVKDAAYAWRQMLFHLSLCDAPALAGALGRLGEEEARHPAHVAARLAPALAGLRLVADGGRFGPDGGADGGRARLLLGWSTNGHWLLAPQPATGSGRG